MTRCNIAWQESLLWYTLKIAANGNAELTASMSKPNDAGIVARTRQSVINTAAWFYNITIDSEWLDNAIDEALAASMPVEE